MLYSFAACFFAWFIPFVPALKWGSVEVTRWEKARGKVVATVGPDVKGWVKLKNISKHVLNAIIASEDSRFYQHPGIDIVEIWNSLKLNIEEGRIARGGSTITQQVVKMAFLSREKSYIRKIREGIGALLLELFLSKSEILEWYINLVEFGDSVYGIKKAAWHYFQIKPQLLSIEQGVHLALVLPSPNSWSFGLRRHRLTSFGHQRFRQILNLMLMSGYISKTELHQAMAQGNFGSPIKGYKAEDYVNTETKIESETENQETATSSLTTEEKSLPILNEETNSIYKDSKLIDEPMQMSRQSNLDNLSPLSQDETTDTYESEQTPALENSEKIP
ncbi:MAG: biosynthetic peptidoglycan transglycosylase [Bdellovibrionota bacterium]